MINGGREGVMTFIDKINCIVGHFCYHIWFSKHCFGSHFLLGKRRYSYSFNTEIIIFKLFSHYFSFSPVNGSLTHSHWSNSFMIWEALLYSTVLFSTLFNHILCFKKYFQFYFKFIYILFITSDNHMKVKTSNYKNICWYARRNGWRVRC